MILTRIELENIASHKRSVIDFQEGINVLHGDNGAGKSTVVRMIGFVLFDYKSRNIKDIIRMDPSNPKEGIVRVYILTRDHEEYILERKITKSGGSKSFAVYYARTKKKITKLSNRTSFYAWLKEQMNSPPNIELSTLFENAVGVNQGTFTAPFLLTPAKRKEIFMPLLNIKVYDTIYDKMRDVERSTEKDIHEIEKKISKLEGVLEDRDEYERELKNIIENLEENSKLLEESKKEHKKIELKYNLLKQQKEEIEKLNTKMKVIITKREGIKKNIKMIKAQLDESKKAQSVCEGLKYVHDQYLEISKEIIDKEKDEKKLRKIEKNLQDIVKKEQKIAGTIAQIKAEIHSIENKKEEYETLMQSEKIYLKNKEEFEKINNEYIKNKEELQNLKKQFRELQKIEREIIVLKEKIVELELIEKKVEKKEEITNNLFELERKKGELDAKIKQIREDREKSKDGMCPILLEPCKNLEGSSLIDYFNEQEQKARNTLSELYPKLKKFKMELEEIRQLEKKVKSLRKAQTQLEEKEKSKEEIKDIPEKIQNLSKIINKYENEKNQKETILNQLEKKHDQFKYLYKEFNEKLPKLKIKYDTIKETLTLIANKKRPIEKKINDLSNVRPDLENLKNKLKEVEPLYQRFKQNEVIAKKYNSLLEKHRKSSLNLNKLTKEENDILNSLKSLKEKFDEDVFRETDVNIHKIEAKIAKLEERINTQKNRKEEIEKKINKLKEIQKKYDKLTKEHKLIEQHLNFIRRIRSWFKKAIPLITDRLLYTLNFEATHYFREITDQQSLELIWEKDFGVRVITPQNEKDFQQLSGGEQMAAALAIRLAILKVLTSIDFAFFDEPTTNLDTESRKNLANCLLHVKGFKQLFVISHDDTFEEMADYVIHFEKNEEEESQISTYSNEF